MSEVITIVEVTDVITVESVEYVQVNPNDGGSEVNTIVEITDVVTIESSETIQTTSIESTEIGQQGPRGIQGLPGPPGGASFQRLAGEAISGHRAMRIEDGKLYYCDGNNAAHVGSCVGISLNAAIINDPVNVQALGEVTEPSWSFTSGALFVQGGGQIGATPGLAFSQEIGRVVNATTLFLNVQPAILRI